MFKHAFNRFRFGIVASALLLAGAALAQVPGTIKITSLVGAFSLPIDTAGPQVAKLPLNGGTFTCTSGGTITVSQTAVDAGSLVVITLKTVGGSFTASPYVATITAATGFSATCATSDTSIYNYLVIG